MDFTPFYIDSSYRACGTIIFTCAAAYAAALVDGDEGMRIWPVAGYHAQGFGRAVAGAGGAVHAISQQTITGNSDGVAY